jgi:SAM-dependent methyltransferase
MASSGVRVVAFDQSEAFLERARLRTTENRDAIEYLQLNASDVPAMLRLGKARFDAAVCSMAIMDMAVIRPLFTTLPRLLKPGGRFVFTVMHPAFNSTCSTFLAQEQVHDGKYSYAFGVWVTDYITPVAALGTGIAGQPEPHWYFHRPISALFNECFQAGFVLDGLEEPVLPPGGAGGMPLSWANCPGVPPVLAARMRLR